MQWCAHAAMGLHIQVQGEVSVMSYRDPRVLAWERKLKEVFDEIDQIMEERHGDRFPLHPSRPKMGSTSTPAADGLFDLGAAFSAGFGTVHGRGYGVSIRLSTLARVPADVMDMIEQEVYELLQEKLPKAFPCRELHIEREDHRFKIVGDLSLA
jgi:hypothetical protein